MYRNVSIFRNDINGENLVTAKILNNQRLQDLVAFFEDVNLVKELIEIYLEQYPSRLTEIEQGLSSNNFQMIELGAHSLKSASLNLGFEGIGNICSQLEKSALKQEISTVDIHYTNLKNEFGNLEPLILQELSQFPK